jgi:hypothetical protein
MENMMYRRSLQDNSLLNYPAVDIAKSLHLIIFYYYFGLIGLLDSSYSSPATLALVEVAIARMKEFVRRSTYVPFRRSLGDVRREFIHRLSSVLHGTLGSYLRNALHDGGAFDIPPRAY